jgi:hypothetical protein
MSTTFAMNSSLQTQFNASYLLMLEWNEGLGLPENRKSFLFMLSVTQKLEVSEILFANGFKDCRAQKKNHTANDDNLDKSKVLTNPID